MPKPCWIRRGFFLLVGTVIIELFNSITDSLETLGVITYKPFDLIPEHIKEPVLLIRTSVQKVKE